MARKPTGRNRAKSTTRGGGALALRERGTAGALVQPFGVLAPRSISLSVRICARSVEDLNQILVESIVLRDLYRKHHWQTAGIAFQSLHELFEAHSDAQAEIVDMVAERIATLGGVSVATPQDVAERTTIPRPPLGRESVPAQLRRLLSAHEIAIELSRAAARTASEAGDDGTNDMLVGGVIRANEKQAWFLSEHLAP